MANKGTIPWNKGNDSRVASVEQVDFLESNEAWDQQVSIEEEEEA